MTSPSSGSFFGGGNGNWDPNQMVDYYNSLMQSPYGQQIIQSQGEASGYQRDQLDLQRQQQKSDMKLKQRQLDMEYQQMIQMGIPESQARIAYQQGSLALQQRGQQLDEDYRQKALGQSGQQFQQTFGLQQELGRGGLDLQNRQFGEGQRQFNQNFGQRQNEFNTNTGMGLANLAANLSGPENWGRFSDAMRGNSVSGEVPRFFQGLRDNSLTNTGTGAPAADNMPGALDVGSLLNNAQNDAMGQQPRPMSIAGTDPGQTMHASGMQGTTPAQGMPHPNALYAPSMQAGAMGTGGQANNMQQTDQMVKGLVNRGGGSLAPGQIEAMDPNEQKMLASRIGKVGGDPTSFFAQYRKTRPANGFSYAA